MEGRQVLSVIEKYNEALDLLDAYDHQALSRLKGNEAIHVLTYEECMEAIRKMRFGDESALFCDGRKRIEDSTLVALTIMIEESRAEEKEMMVSVVAGGFGAD